VTPQTKIRKANIKLFFSIASLLLIAMLPTCCAVGASERNLVLHFPMDEGRGNILTDASANKIAGKIHEAKWIKIPGGSALEFDGRKSYVDCGAPAQLDLRGPMTMMAWICPAQIQVAKEPGILGKNFSSYLLTYYRNRNPYFYIDGGDNSASATAPPAIWSHLAAVFDGKTLTLYVDGELARSAISKQSQINRGGKFYIGAFLENATTPDSHRPLDNGFKGMIDDVKVFNRGLSAAEIRAEFKRDGGRRNSMFALEFPRVKQDFVIKRGAVKIAAGKNGAIEIANGKNSIALESEFSFPGSKIGFHKLPEKISGETNSWRPRVTRLDDSTLQIEAAGNFYSLKRILRFQNERIELEDTLRNLTDKPVGVLISHHFIAPENLRNARAMTTADNPTIFFSLRSADFGIVAEDDVARLQFESSAAVNQAAIQHSSFALDAGKSYTFRYAIYPLAATGDIYEFFNRVRRDWKSNFTIEGPFEFFGLFDPHFKTPGALAKYLQRKNLKLVALNSFLDYDPGSLDHVLPRGEYKIAAQKIARIFHEIDPGIKVLGCIETDWVTLFPEKIKDASLLENGTPEQITKVIDDSDLPWKKSIKRNREGHVELERYVRGGKPQLSLSVFPAAGNAQEKFLLDQAKFLIEDAGLDGIYIDEFNQSWNRNVRSYDGWDGVSVEINSETGKIEKKFVSCGLAGIPSRLAIMNYVFSRGKTLVANTWATSAREQSLPAQRFWEMQDYVQAGGLRAGEKPPLIGEMMEGLLGSPIGLGISGGAGNTNLSEGLMLGLISYLRHGLLYFHYWYPDLPESGEYGPINHMFPFTPVALHEGWMEGLERIVTCISGKFFWKNSTKPVVHLFGLDGREKTNRAEIKRDKSNWEINLPLKDWAEIAVISAD